MEFLKAQLARLQQQFHQLTASQKMLSVSLVAIMVMTLLWWGRYAGQPDMEPVIDRDFTPEEVAHLTADLRARNIPVSSVGTRVLVPADRKPEALGALVYSQSLPADSSSTMLLDIMAKATGPFSTDKQVDIAYVAAREAFLASMIRGFPGVLRANVAIAVPQRHTAFDDAGISATVDVHLNPGQKYDPHMPSAVAEIMTGGVPNLKRKDVHVVIDSKARAVPSDDADGTPADSSASMEALAASELYYQNKLRETFSFCEGITAHVSVELDNKTSDIHETKYDPKGVVSRPTEDTSDTTNSSRAGQGAGGDVGVAPNTGAANAPMSIGGPGGGGEGQVAQSSEKTSTKTQNYVPQIETTTHQRGGKPTVTAASVMFPRSFFVKAYLHENHADKEPTPAIMDAYIKAMCTKFRDMVKATCDNPPDENVRVAEYPDFVNPLGDAPTQAVGGVSLLLSNHAKEIALGTLALVSLFMVSMMVRKSGPALAGGAAGEGGVTMIDGQPVPTGVAGSTVDAIIGKVGGKGLIATVTDEVAEGNPMLDGVEVDDEAVRTRQVAEQVVTLVKDNPDAAASLIKRWMNRT